MTAVMLGLSLLQVFSMLMTSFAIVLGNVSPGEVVRNYYNKVIN